MTRRRNPWNAALDASVYFSFDRSGYRRHAQRFDPADLRVDLSNKTCLVTGANSGIGFATAEALARLGAEVRLLCRNAERGQAALQRIRASGPGARVHLDILDVSNLEAIRAYADALPVSQVDVLVHNAGVLPAERHLTSEGLELTFATHVAGPFLLTQQLRARLLDAESARVILVSSGGMYTQRLSLDDLAWSRRPYDGVQAYAQTKRMQVVLAKLFAERWAKTPASFHAMHPGWADTPAVQTSLPAFWKFTQGRLRTPAQGADTIVWLAAASSLPAPSGTFWFDRAPRSEYILPFKRESLASREALWSLCQSKTASPGAST